MGQHLKSGVGLGARYETDKMVYIWNLILHWFTMFLHANFHYDPLFYMSTGCLWTNCFLWCGYDELCS